MIYFLISITAFTLLFVLLYRTKIVTVCPICAGVVITWIGGIIGLYSHQAWADPLLIAILMGASLGALADKYGNRLGLLWKSAVVLLGLPAIYFLATLRPLIGLIILGVLVIFTIIKLTATRSHKDPNRDLFKDCC